MNIENIALVRATDFIPFDGILRPLANVPYLCKKSGSELSFKISDLLRELNVTDPIDYSNFELSVARNASKVREYTPYESDYNSIVLFSINGLCPDDSEAGFGNNTFSNKKVAIIEPLKYHLDQTISLVPTDTALKGDVILSDEAILLIDEDLYNSLTDEQKQMLHSNSFTIKTFRGSLKEAVKQALSESKKYTAEDLSLSSSTGGIKPSDTSEEVKEVLHEIARINNILEMKFFNLITSRDDTLPKFELFCKEFKNIQKVSKFYTVRFLEQLLIFLGKPEMVEYVEENYWYEPFLNDVFTWIKEKGIEEFKRFVDDYNNELLTEMANGVLPTPEQIVNMGNGFKNNK